MGESGTVSAELVTLITLYAGRRRIDPAPSLRALRLAELRDGERTDGARVAALLARFAELTGDPLFGLRLGCWARSQPVHHLVLATVLNSPTAGQALERLLRLHALLADALAPTLVQDGAATELRVEGGRPGGADRQLSEAAVSMLAGLVGRFAVGPGPVEVILRSPPVAPKEHYRSALRATVRFGAPFDAVRFSTSSLEAPMPLSDPELAEVLDRHARGRLAALSRATWTASTARAVRLELAQAGRLPELAEVARSLATPARTLQARLLDERTGYRAICDEVRRERGVELLRSETTSLVEVAFLLGFADQSAFTNSFRRWTGRTPAAYRRSISPLHR